MKKQKREAEKKHQIKVKNRKKYIKRSIVLVIVVLSVAGVGKLMQQPATSSEPVPTAGALAVKADDWIKGNKDATVTLIEYLDFECEACGAYYPLIKRLSEEYSDEVTFVTRYFPLPGHRNSMTSALAMEAAGKQGRYWDMYDLLFQEQQNWGELASPNPAIFEQYAKQIGLDMERYAQDIASEEVRDRIIRDLDEGEKLGVKSTPTFFLNGEKIQNPRGYEAFVSILEKALQK